MKRAALAVQEGRKDDLSRERRGVLTSTRSKKGMPSSLASFTRPIRFFECFEIRSKVDSPLSLLKSSLPVHLTTSKAALWQLKRSTTVAGVVTVLWREASGPSSALVVGRRPATIEGKPSTFLNAAAPIACFSCAFWSALAIDLAAAAALYLESICLSSSLLASDLAPNAARALPCTASSTCAPASTARALASAAAIAAAFASKAACSAAAAVSAAGAAAAVAADAADSAALRALSEPASLLALGGPFSRSSLSSASSAASLAAGAAAAGETGTAFAASGVTVAAEPGSAPAGGAAADAAAGLAAAKLSPAGACALAVAPEGSDDDSVSIVSAEGGGETLMSTARFPAASGAPMATVTSAEA